MGLQRGGGLQSEANPGSGGSLALKSLGMPDVNDVVKPLNMDSQLHFNYDLT